MANYETLKTAIQQVVKTNGNNEIKGALLQQSLLAMINSLGTGYQYMGIATTTTNPRTPDQNVFYIASQPGTYSNFDGIVVTDEVVILKYNGSWSKESTGIAPNMVAKESFATHFGIIGVADGQIVPNNESFIYTDAISAKVGDKFQLINNTQSSLGWYRVFFYQDDTFVSYNDLGGTFENIDYVLPSLESTYNKVRFNISLSSGDFASVNDISVNRYLGIIDAISWLDGRISAIESLDVADAITEINNNYRFAKSSDITQSMAGKFEIENGALYVQRKGADPAIMMIFNANVTGIEFEISSLWDSNLISLCFGIGIDAGNNKESYATCYLPTSSRPDVIGCVSNYDKDGVATAEQPSSIWGDGHYSGDYRQPQVTPAAVSVGSKCRIELLDGHYFAGSIYNTTKERWEWWFCLDANGKWNAPQRYGWSTRKAIGFCAQFFVGDKIKILDNLKVITDSSKLTNTTTLLSRNFPDKKQWVAIGDSITEIDKNNGLSYVGYAQRKLGFKVDNQGQGGWTIYKLWRDRATAGWENAVSAINNGDLVTILAGTNDFDTDSFGTLASDEAMDAAPDPHPRFGTTDPTSEDAKDPHTTLGCLRLIIERILELKPGTNLIIFAPFYREKGAAIGETSWEKLYVNSDGKTIYDYAQAITDVAREYNLPSFNTCKDCGINKLTLSSYTYDDLHIGQLGGILIGDYVAKRIKL